MYLNYQLVPGFPITLRNGEERDCEYLASVFSEVWTGIPDKDRAAILARGYGCVTVDVRRKPETFCDSITIWLISAATWD